MSVANQRRELIRNLLAEHGRLTVEELSPLLEVTVMTVRRDLAAMERTGLLTRTHGGCVLQAPFVGERPFAEKDLHRRAQKYAIAGEAAQRLSAGAGVYLDTGTTAVHVARLLPTNLALRVLTNNLRVAMELFARQGVEVCVYGGTLAGQSPDLLGEAALARINDLRVDVAMLGADAVDAQRGEFYSADMGSALLSQAAQRSAEKTFVLVDSSKFGKHSLAVAGRMSESVTVITDQDLPELEHTALVDTGANVVLARGTDGTNRKRAKGIKGQTPRA